MKTIIVKPDKVALVDDDNYDCLNRFNWNVFKTTRTVYAESWISKNMVLMHRLVLNLKPGDNFITDHIDHNGLNNQKTNLRVVSKSANSANMEKYSIKCSSTFKGVCWHKSARKWMASIKHHGTPYYLGLFSSELEAAEAYNKKAQFLFGDYAWLNNLDAGGRDDYRKN